MIVDSGVYSHGKRQDRPATVEGLRRDAEEARGFAWVGLFEPTAAEFEAVKREFDLHRLAVDDAISAHQRPKLELYGDTLFLVLKTVRYLGTEEVVEIGEVLIFVGPSFIITVRHGAAGGLGDVREKLEHNEKLLEHGPGAALYAVVDRIVDAYEPVVAGVREDVDQVEEQVFSSDGRNPVERIYKLRRETLEFSRAVAPLPDALTALTQVDLPQVPPELGPYFRDVADHAARVAEQVDGFGSLLTGVLQANLTQVSVRQNEDMRRISAWVAIIAVPTMIAGIYGMNFEYMPELEWRLGYPAVLLLIAVVCGLLYRRFRKAGWL